MDKTYLVYSAQGWWGTGTFTSDLKAAKRFTQEEAIEFCRTRYNPLGNISVAIPVAEADVMAVFKK